MAAASSSSPTPRLILALAGTLLAIGLFSWYALQQLDRLRDLQSETVDRNRKDSLQLLRIQSNLNSVGLALRDMTEGSEPYGLAAWRAEFARYKEDFADALRVEAKLASRPKEQTEYLARSAEQLWRSGNQVFDLAENGEAKRAMAIVRNSLQAQQASLSSTVARLLVQNNDLEEQAFGQIQTIYRDVERKIYLFLAIMLLTISGLGLYVIASNRLLFSRLESLSAQRSTLARRLINLQEEIFRSVSRELHDDFGQILTAIGTMLTRADRKSLPADSPLREDLAELRGIVSETLEKTRSFSQALHPTVLDDYGLEKAVERYLPTWSRQHGVEIDWKKEGSGSMPEDRAIHVYRILQESLNNVAKHSEATRVFVRLTMDAGRLRLDVEDNGKGIDGSGASGLGLIAMRERAESIGGKVQVGRSSGGGTLVSLEAPLAS